MGGGRFVEVFGPKRIVVGAKDSDEADEVLAEWQMQQKRNQEQEAVDVEVERLRAKREEEELAMQGRVDQLTKKRTEEEQRRAQEAERQRQEDERFREAETNLLVEKERLESMALEEAKLRKDVVERAQREEDETRKKLVDAFLQTSGFLGVNQSMSMGWAVWKPTTVYPIHLAAEKADARMVKMLIREGADTQLRNSLGQSALEVAQEMDKDGSHTAVITVLGVAPKPCWGGA